MEADGTLRTVWGQGYGWTGPQLATAGVPAALSTILGPSAPDVLPDGRLLVLESYDDGEHSHERVLAMTPGEAPGVAHGDAGTGQLGVAGNAGDGRAACDANLGYPTSVARAADGSTYIADYANSQIRRISPDGRITTVAGTGLPGFAGDGGPATAAQLDRPRALAVDPAGRVLIADVVNNRVRRLDPGTGTITTIAGTGQWGSTGDAGPAAAARLAGPHGVAVSPDGTVWVADTGNHTLRRISPDGTISTAAGTGTAGGSGDGGPATAARLSSPRGVAADSRAVYVADPGTSSVRRLDLATGTISTLAGPVTGTPLDNPASLLPTATGLLVADAGSNRVLRIAPSGSVTVVVGTGSNGPAMSRTVAQAALKVNLAQPQGLAVEADGTLLVADTAHQRLLRITRP